MVNCLTMPEKFFLLHTNVRSYRNVDGNLVMEKLEKHAMNRVTVVESFTIMHVVHFVVIL